MNRKLVIVAVAALGLTFVAERWLVKPVLAQVRAALTQNIDEPGRAPFGLSRFLPPGVGSYSFGVPTGVRYVVDNYTADCFVKSGTAMTEVNLLGVTGGSQVLLTGPAHLAFSSRGLYLYRATASGPLYADPGSALKLGVLTTAGDDSTVDGCNVYVTGHSVQNP